MFWSASRLMSKPVRLLARRTDSYVHAHTVLRSPMRLFAPWRAPADSYDAGDDNDGIGNGAGVGSMPVQLPTVVMPELLRSLERLLERSLERRRFTRRLTLPMWPLCAQAAADSFHIGAVRVRAADRGRGGGRVVAVRHACAFRAALGRDIRFGGSHGCRMAVSDGDGGAGTGARIQSAACRRTAGIGRGGRSVHYQTGWHCRRC